jgi:hypothetical protein
MSLKDKALQLNNNGGVPFMEGRELNKDLPLNGTVTIVDYGFIKGDDGEYVVLALKEFPKNFFFGGSVISEKMLEIDKGITDDELKEIHEIGLPVAFTKRKNKAGRREYTTCEFYPEI